MIHEELEQAYGPYVAEMVRQALTIEEFNRLDMDELVQYFALRAAQTYQEYVSHQNMPASSSVPTSVAERDVYLDVLRRRWQQAEELAQTVLTAQRDAQERDSEAVGF